MTSLAAPSPSIAPSRSSPPVTPKMLAHAATPTKAADKPKTIHFEATRRKRLNIPSPETDARAHRLVRASWLRDRRNLRDRRSRKTSARFVFPLRRRDVAALFLL